MIRLLKLPHEKKKDFINFIKKHHSKNHIFAKSMRVLDWFYYSKKNYNFIIALKNNLILGVQGFIPINKFDNNLDNSIFLSYWRVKSTEEIGVGLKIFKFLSNNKNFMGVVGINDELIPYHKWQGFKIGRLGHYFYVNKEYKYPKMISQKYFKLKKKKFKKIKFQELNKKTIKLYNKNSLFNYQYPKKSAQYITRRYLDNPFYDYKIFLVSNYKQHVIFVFRLINIKNTRILKIIDFIGKEEYISFCGEFFKDILVIYNAEYLDFYIHGVKKKYLKKADLVDRYKSGLIIPDHFEPYEHKNIDINFAYKYKIKISKKSESHIRFCKGDGDMDRPSVI